MMQIQKSAGITDASRFLSEIITNKLQVGENVLFLITGGSGIAVVVAVARSLRESGVPLAKLTVMQTDERFGDVGHKGSNWKQLEDKGFALPGATLVPTLRGLSLGETVKEFGKRLEAELQKATFRIGLFGMGADGHTAGILPESSALNEKAFVHGYEAPPYIRITMTVPAILTIDIAVLYAMGEEKRQAIENLKKDPSINIQPAQVLKSIPRFVVFTDTL